MRTRRVFCIVAMASILLGCASASISPADRSALRRVSIADLALPEKPFVLAPSAGGAFLLAGPLGVAIANGTTDLPQTYQQVLAANKIDVASMIRAEVMSQLKSKRIQVVENGSQADAVLTVDVLQYGLTGDVFSEKRFPQLNMRMSLTKKDGTVIWKNYDAAHISRDVQKTVEWRTVADYLDNPKLLEAQTKKVTQMIIASVMKTL